MNKAEVLSHGQVSYHTVSLESKCLGVSLTLHRDFTTHKRRFSLESHSPEVLDPHREDSCRAASQIGITQSWVIFGATGVGVLDDMEDGALCIFLLGG